MSLNHPVMFGVRGSYSICSGENIGNPRATTITCFGFQNEVTASSLFPRHCLDGPVKAFQLWNYQSQHEPISFLERKVIRTGTKMAKNSVSGRSFSLEKKWRSCSKRRMWVHLVGCHVVVNGRTNGEPSLQVWWPPQSSLDVLSPVT